MYFPGETSTYPLRDVNSFRTLEKEYDLVRPPVALLPSFQGPSFYGLDEMHLLALGLFNHMVELFKPIRNNIYVFDKAHCLDCPFHALTSAITLFWISITGR
ncbi:unnamed protein product [Absidia cylindrospora]